MVTVTRDPERHRILPGEGYDGVVQVVADGGVYGSGVLLHGGRAVLTSAHLLDGADSVTVRLDTPAGRVSLSTAYHVLQPGYDATQANSDLALVWLDAPAPVTMERSTLYRGDDEIGQTLSLVGYGLSGDGLSGYDEERSSPTKRLAENRFDTTGEALKAALGTGIAWDPSPGSQLIIDFDDGSDMHDALGVLMGDYGTGLGEREGLIAPGDSGGPAFIGDRVAGVATYAASLSRNGQSPDVNGERDSSFGEIAAFQRVSHYQQWIDQSLRNADPNAPTRPEDVETAILEGDAGAQLAYFLLEFHGERDDPAQWLSVDYATRDGTATAGEDYLAVADTLILYPGETQAAIAVEVIGDATAEPDETFYLDVFNPVGGSFGGGVTTLSAVRTIVDDDGWIA